MFRTNRKLFLTLFLTISSFTYFSCGSTSSNPVTTQLQIREYQTKLFNTGNTKLVMKAVSDTLQDLGYIIKNANTDLGLIVAEKDVDIENKWDAFFAALFAGSNARWAKLSKEEVTVNISPYGENRTKVRVNAVVKVIDNKGGILKVQPITNKQYYQNFFTAVSKSIFLAKEKL